jgi:K+-transporting ATPase KdpF subunit
MLSGPAMDRARPGPYAGSMSIELAAAGVIAIVLLAYLVYSIVRPERF